MAGAYPHITEMVAGIIHDEDTTLGWCDDQVEFEFALDLLPGRTRDAPGPIIVTYCGFGRPLFGRRPEPLSLATGRTNFTIL